MTTVELRHQSGKTFNIIADGDAVGYVHFQERGDGGYIERVFVEDKHRGNKYGRAAVGELLKRYEGELTSGDTASPYMEAILREHEFEFRPGEERPEGCEADLWIKD